MKRYSFFIIIAVVFASCKSSQKTITVKPKTDTITIKPNDVTVTDDEIKNDPSKINELNPKSETSSQIDNIINTAISYKGTRYRMGGTTKAGMDCSGLVFTSFKNNDITLHRSSYDIAAQGTDVKLEDVRKGDLLFFNTNPKGKRINHVGLVTNVSPEIFFIHATTSRGVLVSSLKEGYWNYSFVKAKRIL